MMIKQFVKAAVVAGVALSGLAATPAMARDHYRAGDYYEGQRNWDRDDDRRSHRRHKDYRRHDNGGYYNGGYYSGGYYNDNRYAYPDRRYRSYQRCDSGATGTILGAVAGGLLGREVARSGRNRRGDGTTGLIIGAGAGALVGRAIDRSGNCR